MVRSKKLECVHCGRTFGMPAHLGRHLNAVHGIGKSAAPVRRPMRDRNRSAAPMGHNGFGQVAVQLQHARETLVEQRATLDSQIEKIGQVLQALS